MSDFNSYARKKAKRHQDNNNTTDDGDAAVTYQCLPIADLAQDFNGNPEDGAEYLAMIR